MAEHAVVVRVNHSAPYNCNTGSCTCNGAGWSQPADSRAGLSSTLALPDGTIEVRAIDWTVSDTPLPVLGRRRR
ncbi:MAG: hypothetical protein HS111_29020 [Kofleriaceae bacterium]|nr:hypothetical protein [Kofleriaceae bacterium]